MEQIFAGLATAVTNLGVGAIFLWLYTKERERNNTQADTMTNAFIKNTETQVKHTDAIDHLAKAIAEVLQSSKQNN